MFLFLSADGLHEQRGGRPYCVRLFLPLRLGVGMDALEVAIDVVVAGLFSLAVGGAPCRDEGLHGAAAGGTGAIQSYDGRTLIHSYDDTAAIHSIYSSFVIGFYFNFHRGGGKHTGINHFFFNIKKKT